MKKFYTTLSIFSSWKSLDTNYTKVYVSVLEYTSLLCRLLHVVILLNPLLLFYRTLVSKIKHWVLEVALAQQVALYISTLETGMLFFIIVSILTKDERNRHLSNSIRTLSYQEENDIKLSEQ